MIFGFLTLLLPKGAQEEDWDWEECPPGGVGVSVSWSGWEMDLDDLGISLPTEGHTS